MKTCKYRCGDWPTKMLTCPYQFWESSLLDILNRLPSLPHAEAEKDSKVLGDTHGKAPHSFCGFSFCRLDTCDIWNITGRRLYQLLQLYSYFQTLRKLHIYSTDCTTTAARDIINNGFSLKCSEKVKKMLAQFHLKCDSKKITRLDWLLLKFLWEY